MVKGSYDATIWKFIKEEEVLSNNLAFRVQSLETVSQLKNNLLSIKKMAFWVGNGQHV